MSERFWVSPVTYSVHGAVTGARLYVSERGRERLVTTFSSGDVDPYRLTADLGTLSALVSLDQFEETLKELAAAGIDVAAPPADQPHALNGGVSWFPSRVLSVPAQLGVETDGPAGALLRLVQAAELEPESSRDALRAELAAILQPLDGVVVRAEYEGFGQLNVAPWVDVLDVSDLRALVADTERFQWVAHRWVRTWAAPGGVLEGEGHRMLGDGEGGLIVDILDAVRRVASTRPEILPDVYSVEMERFIRFEGFAECLLGMDMAHQVMNAAPC